MDSETLKEVVVSSGAVATIIGIMIYIGMTYGGNKGVLAMDGGRMLAYAIAFFVVLMAVIGYTRKYWLDLEDE
ncbi:DUF7472 family protein [Haloarchaeobius amylolyticus]|uniref:DUF7472 family protein n=1 Tax=Haloarchaeobius amylolyticus TaxID=1198296 RepID=UPI002270493B|nr:hypothetical protein [Haloarchaeobius amylolyticus]